MTQPGACIETDWAHDRKGYGVKSIGGRSRRAHRWAWEQANGPIPDGLLVLHHCDNPPCINPAHLYLGTEADNHRDASERLRWRHGESAYNAKLSDQAVREIRLGLAVGIAQTALAREYGVSPRLIRGIKRGEMWRHVADAPGLPHSIEVGSVSGSPKLPHAYNVEAAEGTTTTVTRHHTDGCAGNCGTNDSDNPPCPGMDSRGEPDYAGQ